MRHAATIICITSLLWAGPAFAHGEQDHVMGSVASIEAGQMQVKTMDGKSVSIRLNEATRYEDAEGNVTDARPAAGQRVVVDVEGPAGALTATEVRFSSKEAEHESHGSGHHEPHHHEGED